MPLCNFCRPISRAVINNQNFVMMAGLLHDFFYLFEHPRESSFFVIGGNCYQHFHTIHHSMTFFSLAERRTAWAIFRAFKPAVPSIGRSEEHTSELQSQS